MREILFRGKSYNKWVYGDLHHASNDKIKIGGTYEHPIEYWVSPETVGQYTGLTDKNGQKIFEGDIVQDIYNKQIFTVVYYNCSFIRKDIDGHHYSPCETETHEVIGNIHDNPELLEEVQE